MVPPDRPDQNRRPKLEFAASERIDRHAQLRTEFVEHILCLPWAFISDESSLMDFDSENPTPQQLVERIKSYYGVDVSDVPGAKIVDILDRIAANRAKAQ